MRGAGTRVLRAGVFAGCGYRLWGSLRWAVVWLLREIVYKKLPA